MRSRAVMDAGLSRKHSACCFIINSAFSVVAWPSRATVQLSPVGTGEMTAGELEAYFIWHLANST